MDIQTQRLLFTLAGSFLGSGVGALLGAGIARLFPEHRRREIAASVMAALTVVGASAGPRVITSFLRG